MAGPSGDITRSVNIDKACKGLTDVQRKDLDQLVNLMSLCGVPGIDDADKFVLAREIVLGKKSILEIPYKGTPAETYSKFQEVIKKYEAKR